MTINWEAGDINSDHHVVKPDQRYPLARSLQPGDVAYIDHDDLYVGFGDKLWLDPNATVMNDDEATELMNVLDLCRVVATEDGIVVDASAGSFTLDEESRCRIAKDVYQEYEAEGWLPIVGLITTDEQRAQFENIAFNKYSIIIGKSILEMVEEGETD